MKQSRPFNRFWCKWMPNLKFYGILNFLKNVCGSSNFRKIWPIILKMHTNIIYRRRTFGIEFDRNRLKRSNFLRFWIVWKFPLNCVTFANFKLLSSKFAYECINVMFHTKFGENRLRPLIFRFLIFFDFFYRDIKFLNFDVCMKRPLWGSQNQTTYFLKGITL